MTLSKEKILEALQPMPHGLKMNELQLVLGLDAKGVHRLRRLLGEMVESGAIERGPGTRYQVTGAVTVPTPAPILNSTSRRQAAGERRPALRAQARRRGRRAQAGRQRERRERQDHRQDHWRTRGDRPHPRPPRRLRLRRARGRRGRRLRARTLSRRGARRRPRPPRHLDRLQGHRRARRGDPVARPRQADRDLAPRRAHALSRA